MYIADEDILRSKYPTVFSLLNSEFERLGIKAKDYKFGEFKSERTDDVREVFHLYYMNVVNGRLIFSAGGIIKDGLPDTVETVLSET